MGFVWSIHIHIVGSINQKSTKRIEIQRRQVEAREIQIELITKQIAPRLIWGLTLLIFGGVAALASKIGIPVALLFDDYP